MDGGDSVADAVCQIVKDVTDDKKNNCCVNTATAAVEMDLDVQEVVASAIDCGCDPLAVGNAAYNAGPLSMMFIWRVDRQAMDRQVYSILRMMLNSLQTGLLHLSFREIMMINVLDLKTKLSILTTL